MATRTAFGLWLTNRLTTDLNTVAMTKVSVGFAEADGKDVCRVEVSPGTEPTYATTSTEKGVFYVRMGNASHKLGTPEAVKYIAERWGA